MPAPGRIGGVGLYVDFRNPPRWQQDITRLYSENIELVRQAEALGFASAWVSEHHFSEDGYLPSPLVVAAALAQATTRIRIGTAVAILPLYHPVRFAEDTAVLDILSAGRLDVGVGVGWRPQEFAAFGVPRAERGSRSDAALALVSDLWSGKPMTVRCAEGPDEVVTLAPRPVQHPRPPIWVGGSTRAALRRAARRADGIVVSDLTTEMNDAYRAELQAAGVDAGSGRIASNLRWFMAAMDPERTFALAAPYVVHWYNHYAAWMAGTGGPFSAVEDEQALRDRALFTVLTPPEAVAHIRAHATIAPLDYLNLKARPPGLPLDLALEHLEVFATGVLPSL